MRATTRRVSLDLPIHQADRLKQRAAARGMSQAEFLRLCLEMCGIPAALDAPFVAEGLSLAEQQRLVDREIQKLDDRVWRERRSGVLP